jgi:hypothetical protein
MSIRSIGIILVVQNKVAFKVLVIYDVDVM